MRRLLLLAAAVAAGCGSGEVAATGGGDGARRAELQRFWALYGQASDARTAKDFATAAGLYEQALNLDARHEDCLYYLGQCRQHLGEHGKARDAFERLVAANDHTFRGHMALAALLASPTEGGLWDLAGAEEHFRAAHAINAEETGALVRLAEVLLVRGDRDGARAAAEAAARSNPKSVEARLVAGFVAWEAGDRTAAGNALAEAYRISRPEAPPKGVLGEGDRKAEGIKAAPALTRTVGETLLAGAYDEVRHAATEPGAEAVYGAIVGRLADLRARVPPASATARN